MTKTGIIFKKEVLDILREKRTVITMILLPLLVFPVIMTFAARITASQAQKAGEKTLKVAYISRGNAEELTRLLKETRDLELVTDRPRAEALEGIKEDSLDFLIEVAADFDQKVATGRTGDITLYYKLSNEVEITRGRVRKLLNRVREIYLESRLREVQLEPSFVRTVEISEVDVSTVQEKIGHYAGGFLPYLFILFCFFGAMYPAIDLGAGEKERYTIETLLASPVSRMEIVLGKFLVVFMAGVTSAVLAIVGLFIAIKQIPEIPPQILESIIKIVEIKSILLMLSLLIPLCAFFAALLLSFSIFANSFKEAQSLMTPMNFLVILPAAAGLLPGVKLTTVTALIPVLNVSLATKEIVSGTMEPGLLVLVYLVMFALAGVSLWFCSRWFNRENVIFRGI